MWKSVFRTANKIWYSLCQLIHVLKIIRWLFYICFNLCRQAPSANAWMAQCCLYVCLMIIVKVSITLFMQLDFWQNVKDFILSPIPNYKVELAFVMLIIPFFVNVSIRKLKTIYFVIGHKGQNCRNHLLTICIVI